MSTRRLLVEGSAYSVFDFDVRNNNAMLLFQSVLGACQQHRVAGTPQVMPRTVIKNKTRRDADLKSLNSDLFGKNAGRRAPVRSRLRNRLWLTEQLAELARTTPQSQYWRGA